MISWTVLELDSVPDHLMPENTDVATCQWCDLNARYLGHGIRRIAVMRAFATCTCNCPVHADFVVKAPCQSLTYYSPARARPARIASIRLTSPFMLTSARSRYFSGIAPLSRKIARVSEYF